MRRLTGAKRELLARLSHMPFLDRLEMVAVSGWSKGAVYEAVGQLEDAGLVGSVPHAVEPVAPTRRFHLTADGMHRLALEEDTDMNDLLRDRPLSARWRRVLLERLDALTVIYRVASNAADMHHPIRFRWYRAMPMDAAITLPDSRVISMVRQGAATDRTGFAKRLWRLGNGPQPGGFLLVVPDEVQLRYARRLMAQALATSVLALEREAIVASPGDPVWRLRSLDAAVGLGEAIDLMRTGGVLPSERPLVRDSMPGDIAGSGTGAAVPEYMVPALLKPAEKRALDLLSDWPWMTRDNLAGLLGVTYQRASSLAAALVRYGLVARSTAAPGRLVLTDRGLAMLARRDRASVGNARKRWSPSPLDARDWREVTGRRSRQLLRDLEHTSAVHGFIAALCRQARALGWEIEQTDPPLRASRYFRHLGRMRSIHPDAFGALRAGDTPWPFFLEWERRAVRPVAMAARLAPYLRYYSTHRPTDDHGAQPAVLVVFHDELAATHFMRVALEEMVRTRTPLPLLVSHLTMVEQEGPLGRAWLAPGGGWEPDFPLRQPARTPSETEETP